MRKYSRRERNRVKDFMHKLTIEVAGRFKESSLEEKVIREIKV